MKSDNNKKAIIYCRVSTKEQVDEGNSLATQEKVCREYAERYGYEVAQVFIEQGESAKTTNRTELQKLFLFCADKKNKISAIIIYKLDRLSRNTDDYSQIRILLKRYNVEIKSTSEHFENNPAGRFMENIIANVAQFDNDVRAERCIGGMKDAMREGRYVWKAPVGYDNVRINGKANIAPNAMAPLVRKTFEYVAQGIYYTEEVRKMMELEGLRLKGGEPLSKIYFYRMLKNELFMGDIVKFGECHKGLFEPIVDRETFEQVRRVLKNKGRKLVPHKRDNPDFPLRRFVLHPNGYKLTGSWVTGRRGQRFPFYRFDQLKGGSTSYPRDSFQEKFKAHMDKYSFKKESIEKLKEFISKKFNKTTERERGEVERLRARLQELAEYQTALVQKNLKGVINDAVLKQQLESIEDETFKIQASLANMKSMDIDVKEVLSFCEGYLTKPSSIWEKANIETKLKLQRFQFPSGLLFDGNSFETPELSLVFSVSGGSEEKSILGWTSGAVFWNQFMRECEYLNGILKG